MEKYFCLLISSNPLCTYVEYFSSSHQHPHYEKLYMATLGDELVNYYTVKLVQTISVFLTLSTENNHYH